MATTSPASVSLKISPPTRSRNTGSLPLTGKTVKLDWLQGTVAGAYFNPVDFFELLLSIDEIDKYEYFPETNFQGKTYRGYYKSLFGCTIRIESDCESPRHLVTLPGSYLSKLNFRQQQAIIRFLSDCGFRCTRMDIAIDDYGKTIRPSEIYSCVVKDGHLNVKGYRSCRYYQSHTSEQYDAGATVEFGKPGGKKKYIIYDKYIESNGQTNSIRYEGRVYKKLAEVYFAEIHRLIANIGYSDEHLYAQLLFSLNIGLVDFVDRDSNPKIERCTKLEFWSDFCADIPSIKLSAISAKNTLYARMHWMARTWSRTISMIKDTMGSVPYCDFLEWLTSLGDAKGSFGSSFASSLNNNPELFHRTFDQLRREFSSNFHATA